MLAWLEAELASGRLLPARPHTEPTLVSAGARLLPDGTSLSSGRDHEHRHIDVYETNGRVMLWGVMIAGAKARPSAPLPSAVADAVAKLHAGASAVLAADSHLRAAFHGTTTDIAEAVDGYEGALRAALESSGNLRAAIADAERGTGYAGGRRSRSRIPRKARSQRSTRLPRR
jgi:hypothetical protein